MANDIVQQVVGESSSDSIELKLPTRTVYRLVATLSILAVPVLIVCTLLVTQSWSRAVAAENLIKQLEVGNLETREAALTSYQAITKPGWLSKFKAWIFVDYQPTKSEIVSNIYVIVSDIGLGKFVEASTNYRARLRPLVHPLLGLVGLNPKILSATQATLKRNDNWAVNVSTLAELEVQAPQRIEQLNNKEEQLVVLSKDLITDFSSFLGFELAQEDNKLVPEFYSHGVLAGLPKIAEVPDEINDLKELRNLLNDLGVKVTVKGADAHEVFTNRLQEFKNQSAIFIQGFNELKTEREQLTTQLTSLRLSVYEDSNIIKSDMLTLLKHATRGAD